jgi:hypothetical protein
MSESNHKQVREAVHTSHDSSAVAHPPRAPVLIQDTLSDAVSPTECASSIGRFTDAQDPRFGPVQHVGHGSINASQPLSIARYSRLLLKLHHLRHLCRTLRTGLLFSAITLRSSIPAWRLVLDEARVAALPDRSLGANAAADAARARMEDAVQETFIVKRVVVVKSRQGLVPMVVRTSSFGTSSSFLAIFEVQCTADSGVIVYFPYHSPI